MSWALKPISPTLGDDYTYDGQLVLQASNYEVPRDGRYAFRKYVEGITFEDVERYLIFNTGFQKTKHEINQQSTQKRLGISIQMTNDTPRYLHQNLWNLARFVYGGGLAIQFYDDFASVESGLSANIYTGYWSNAVEFLQNQDARYSANIVLETYDFSTVA